MSDFDALNALAAKWDDEADISHGGYADDLRECAGQLRDAIADLATPTAEDFDQAADEITATDMLGVAVNALEEIAAAPDLGMAQITAASTLDIIRKRLAGDSEWQLVSRGEPARPPAEPKRYALVEQMGHRATVGAVREVTFAGKQMVGLTDLKTGRDHLISPESLYEVTWLTEAEARSRARPWTAAALPAAHYDTWDERDDADRSANGEDDDEDNPEE